jgi:hypothetical protein
MVNVIENFIPVDAQNQIENLLFDQNFPWFFNPQTVYEDLNKGYFFNDKNTVSGSQFNHTFLADYKINSDFCKNLTDLMFYFALNSGVKVNNPVRIKANLTTPDLIYAENLHRPAHYDSLDSNIITAIYYVNDADGDTIFFADPDVKESNEVEELKELKRVAPKKGQMVYFKSNTLHANALCKDVKYRCVINFNFAQERI